MKKNFNYSDYGAFKTSRRKLQTKNSIAKFLGLKNRYLRFIPITSKDKPIIEIGCGDGAFINALLDAGFTNVKGVDPSNTYNKTIDPELITHDFAEPYLLKQDKFSVGTIIALDVFEHIPQDELHKLLILISSRLLDGGTLILRVPNMASPLAMINYYGDISHTTPLNEISLQQIAFGTGMKIQSINSEPFAYPRSMLTFFGILFWPIYYSFNRIINAAFGISTKILTPNIVCIMEKVVKF